VRRQVGQLDVVEAERPAQHRRGPQDQVPHARHLAVGEGIHQRRLSREAFGQADQVLAQRIEGQQRLDQFAQPGGPRAQRGRGAGQQRFARAAAGRLCIGQQPVCQRAGDPGAVGGRRRHGGGFGRRRPCLHLRVMRERHCAQRRPGRAPK
jgi:hypothetical protein